MAEFKSKGKDLFIDGKKVLRGWESFKGWYWFATEKIEVRTAGGGNGGGSMINGKEVDDVIWFGLVQGFDEEWGYFSEAELKSVGNMVWEIPRGNLPFSGRRESAQV